MAKKKKPKTNKSDESTRPITIKNINEIGSAPPGATGSTSLHPNFVAARKATQFQPGQSGNPGGRRKPLIRDLILKQGLTVHDKDVSQRTYLDLIVYALYQEGLRGRVPAAKELFDRIDGPPHSFDPDKETQGEKLDQFISAIRNPVYEIARKLGIDEDELMTKALEYAIKALQEKAPENAEKSPERQVIAEAGSIE